MKAGRFLVLMLLVASALVIGTTTGLIVGMTDVNKAAANISVTQNSVPSSAPSSKPSVSVQKTTPPAVTVASETDSSVTDSSAPQDLSGADIAQVETMLQKLGYNTSRGIVPAVQQYQKDNSLNATGALDIDTLQSMVDQIRLSRVKQLTKAS